MKRPRVWLLACLAWGCTATEAPAPAVQRLLPDGAPATLGSETRPATGPPPQSVFRGEIDLGAKRRRGWAVLPPRAATGRYALLHWVAHSTEPRAPLQGPAPIREVVRVTAVDHRAPEPRVRLKLDEVGRQGRAWVWVKALPLPDTPEETLRLPVTLPEAASFEVGYGLREECWSPDGAPASFRVELVDAAGARHPLFEAELDPRREADRRWFDARVDLARWAGSAVTLELTTTRTAPTALSLPVWSEPTVYGPAPDDPPPSVVLVSLDTLRARSLGTYGYGRDTSPFFDDLAEEGTLFTRAMTTAVSTSPSHMSLFTGLYPPRHGVLAGMRPRAKGVTSLAQLLRAHDYETAAFTEDGYVDAARFGPGFRSFTENAGDSNRRPGLARVTFAQAREWLERGPRRPFLLFVHTYQVHAPYDPPAPYAGLFADDGAPGPDDALLHRYRDDYDREIRLLDDELRAFFATLKQGAAGDTVAVVVADHGEEFGEHGRYQHGGAVFDETIRVPLLFWGPGRIPGGARREEPVSIVDVTPTLLDLVGLPVPAGLDGESLAAAIRGGAPLPSRTFFAEARTPREWLREFESRKWATPLFAVVSEDTKFVVQRPEEGPRPPILRYDLASDPDERSPRILEGAEAAAVDQMLDTYLDAGPAPEAAEAPEVVEPDLQERLRALGYVQ